MKLSDLVREYGGNAFIMVDDGSGSAFDRYEGVFIDADEEALAEYGDIDLQPIESSSPWAGRDDVNFESDWIVVGQGDNPYRYKILF